MTSLWLSHLTTASRAKPDLEVALANAAELMFPHGRYHEAGTIFREIREQAATVGDNSAELIAELGIAESEYLDLSQTGASQNSLVPLIPTYTSLAHRFHDGGDPGAEAFCLKRIAWAHISENRPDRAEAVIAEARQLAESAGDDYVLGYVLYCEALLATGREEYSVALAKLDECERIRHDIGDWHGVGAARIGKSKVYGALGRYGDAMITMQSAGDIFKSLKNDYVIGALATHTSALAATIQVATAPNTGSAERGLARFMGQFADYARPTIKKLNMSIPMIWPG